MSSNSAPSARQEAELARLRQIERSLDQQVDSVWACSEEDRREFQVHNELPVFTVPNGVDTRSKPFDFSPAKRQSRELLFCGSLNYPPNWQGLRWFLREVWPAVRKDQPATRLTIVGSGVRQEQLGGELSRPNVSFAGEAPDVAPWYVRASVALCPLLTGSGTRLKILEAMSFGAPVVSTQIGAEGIEAVDGQHLLLADKPEAFAGAIARLHSDPVLYERIRQSARRLVEQRYDWDIIGQIASRALESTLAKPAYREAGDAKIASTETNRAPRE
jgi:glycosyltransferase involved in cell wall biosynthesis